MPLKRKTKTYIAFILFLLLINPYISFSQSNSKSPHRSASKNSGISKSTGSVKKGSLKNSYRLPRKGANYKSFSRVSYRVLGRAYVNSRVYATVLASYKAMEKARPEIRFRYMECSKKKGGKMRPHRTHQNGLSIDFMTPLTKKGRQFKAWDHIGLFRYLVNFDNQGKAKLNKRVEIDFETLALHVLTLDKIGRKYGVKVKKVILKTELKDDVFATPYGKELKRRGIYFVRRLSKLINKLHDDHYHVDFTVLK